MIDEPSIEGLSSLVSLAIETLLYDLQTKVLRLPTKWAPANGKPSLVQTLSSRASLSSARFDNKGTIFQRSDTPTPLMSTSAPS